MASPTTTTLVVAILRSRASTRSRVMCTKCGMRNAECGISTTVHVLREAHHSIPHSAFRISHSWDPPFFFCPPLYGHGPHPPRLLRSIMNEVHTAVSRHHPAPMRRMPGNREAQRASDDAGED